MIPRRRRKTESGFTILEVIVTAIVLTIALVASYEGIAAMDNARAYAVKADLLQRLGVEKLADVQLLQDPSADGGSGDFSDRGYPNITWNLTENTTSVTNLDEVSVTVTQSKQSQVVTTQMYVVPQSTSGTSTATTATTGGG